MHHLRMVPENEINYYYNFIIHSSGKKHSISVKTFWVHLHFENCYMLWTMWTEQRIQNTCKNSAKYIDVCMLSVTYSVYCFVLLSPNGAKIKILKRNITDSFTTNCLKNLLRSSKTHWNLSSHEIRKNEQSVWFDCDNQHFLFLHVIFSHEHRFLSVDAEKDGMNMSMWAICVSLGKTLTNMHSFDL